MSRGTLEIRWDPKEWPRGFKDVPNEDYHPSLHFFPLKKIKKENFIKEQKFIHSIRKYKDKIHRLKADATDAAPLAGLVTLDSLDSPQTKIGSCRMQFIYSHF